MKTTIIKIQHFIEKKANLLKYLFVLSILIFVIIEVSRMLRDTDWSKISNDITSRSPLELLIMLILGLIAVLPMINYDFLITEFLPGKYSKRYIFKSGWIVNTLTNIAGFGGFLGAALRANFYGEKASKKEVFYAISKIALFLLSGLSVLSWIALIDIVVTKQTNGWGRHDIWLLLAGLYFPAVLLATRFKQSEFFQDLKANQIIRLIVGSTMEWAFVSLFFLLIGYFVNISLKTLIIVFPMYIIASVLGIISMIPGGIGSFDVFMLLQLMGLGIPKETVLIWLIYFRLFYYLVPAAIGIFFMLHDMGGKLNKSLNGIPQALGSRISHGLITIFLYFSGIFMFLESALPEFTIKNNFLAKLYPLTFLFIHQATNILFAFSLLGLARGIFSRVKKAYIPTLVFIVIGIFNTIYNTIYTDLNWSLLVYLSVVLILMLFSKDAYYRKQLQYSWGALWTDAAIFGGGFVLYFIVGAVNRTKFSSRHHIPSQFLFPDQGVWLAGLLGLLFAGLILAIIITYLTHGKDPFKDTKPDFSRAKAIIANFGGNETSHLAFLGDKKLFFYQKDGKDTVFFMYKATINKLVIMGEPVGNKDDFDLAIQDFLDQADLYDYELVFYEVGEKMTMLLHEYGFDFIKIGEDAWLKLDQFTLSGKKQKGQRALMNKFEREEYQFSIIEPPFSTETLAELHKVSNSWLGSQPEKGFSLGYFSKDYLNQAPIAIVRSKEGQLVAFATLMPTGGKQTLTIDLMRHDRQLAPSGIMDEIFINLFWYGQKEGYDSFYLGMAPLSNVGSSKYSFLGEKVANFIYEYGNRLYAFQGLRNYKNKYATSWHPKYIAYQKKSYLASTTLQLVLLINQRADSKKSALRIRDIF